MHGLNTLSKSCAIAGYLSISIINLIIYLHPSQGYELSIYDTTPISVWLLIIVSAFCGIIIIIASVVQSSYRFSSSWIQGLLLLLLARLTTLYIPYNRGYISWNGDNITHNGFVNDILQSGFISNDNFYPITHIFLSEIRIISDVQTYLVVNYSTAIFSVFFILSFYLIGNMVFPDKKYTLLTLASVGCVIFNRYDLYVMPNGWSVLYFPFMFFVVISALKKNNTFAYSILAIILLVMITFFHPVSTLMMITILIVPFIILISINNVGTLRKVLCDYIRLPTDFNPLLFILILVAIWIPWVLSFGIFEGNVKNFFDESISGASVNVIGGMSEKLNKMNFNIIDTLILILKQMGDELIFLSLFFLGSFIVMMKCRHRLEFEKLFFFISSTLIFGFLYMLYLFNLVPGLTSLGADRSLAYLVLFIPPLAGVVYIQLLKRHPWVYSGLCVILILIPVVLSILSFYPSPYVSAPSAQVSVQDMEGYQWTFDSKQDNVAFAMIMNSPYRFADGLMGTVISDQRSDLKNTEFAPDHFNYPMNGRLGQFFTVDRFLVITMQDKIVYNTVYKPVGRFDDADFSRLRSDHSVDWLYSNGESDVVYIHGNYI